MKKSSPEARPTTQNSISYNSSLTVTSKDVSPAFPVEPVDGDAWAQVDERACVKRSFVMRYV